MKSFTDALEVDEIIIHEDREKPFVHIKFLDPKNNKPYRENFCFWGVKNIEIAKSLNKGDKFHVETNEFSKKDGDQWRNVVIRTLMPASRG